MPGRLFYTKVLLNYWKSIFSIGSFYAFKPGVQNSRVCFKPLFSSRTGLHAVGDILHNFVFHRQGEFKIAEELSEVRVLFCIAGTNNGVHGGLAVVGAEVVIAPLKVGQVKYGVHRMWLPA